MFRTAGWYRRLHESALTWQILNLPSRLMYVFGHQALSPHEASAVADLTESGIAIRHIADFFPPETFQELERYVEQQLMSPAARAEIQFRKQRTGEPLKRKQSFLVDLWGGEHEFGPSHPFLRFSLSAPVLNIVNGYLGCLAKFRAFFLQATLPLPAGTAAYASQRWHADPDDRRMVKVFLYLNDVDETSGPFTYIRYSHSGGKWRSRFPYAPKRQTRHPDPALVEQLIPRSDMIAATGQRGSLIFCDTSGIHRGGYATQRERLMYTSVYTTRAGALPTRYRYVPSFNPETLEMRQARYAVRH